MPITARQDAASRVGDGDERAVTTDEAHQQYEQDAGPMFVKSMPSPKEPDE
jgi:hypothetical protein